MTAIIFIIGLGVTVFARFVYRDDPSRDFIAGMVAVSYCLAVILPSAAKAHDFYDPWCCSGKDCQPTLLGEVSWSPEGWLVPQFNQIVPFTDKRIRHSPADVPGFHICEWPKGKLRCLYVPEPQG